MRSPVQILWILLCLLSVQTPLRAQFQLVLENPNAFKRDRILVGSEIGLRVKGMDQVYRGELERVKADKIYIFGDSLSPDSLDRFQVARGRGGINMLRGALIMSAIVYPVMLVLNQKTSYWTWKRAATVGAFSASALLVQRLLKVAYWKRYRLDRGNWRLKIMPTPESLLPDSNP